eukprot:COSAG02_NODE_1932_length_10324_cov_92.894963_1_plen_98_part_00
MSVHEDSDDSDEDLYSSDEDLNIPQQFASAADVVRMVRVEGERCDLTALTGVVPWEPDVRKTPICPVFLNRFIKTTGEAHDPNDRKGGSRVRSVRLF